MEDIRTYQDKEGNYEETMKSFQTPEIRNAIADITRHDINQEVVNFANQMLGNLNADFDQEHNFTMMNMDDVPFLNANDDIDNFDMRLDEPNLLMNETGFFEEGSIDTKMPNKKAKAKQVQQIRKDLLKYDKRTQLPKARNPKI